MTQDRRGLALGLKIWLDVLFYLALVAGALWLVFIPISGLLKDGGSDMSVPVVIGENSFLPILPVEVNQEASPDFTHFRIMKAQGELRFLSSSPRLHLVLSPIAILALGALLWGFSLLRQILATTTGGHPFHPMNVRRLNTLGWIIVSASMGTTLLQYLAAKWMLSQMEILTVPLSPPIQIYHEWIFSGLLVLVLASIWKQAVRMAEEQSLTV